MERQHSDREIVTSLRGQREMGIGDRFITEVYLPDHNARFAAAPEQPESAFVADRAGAHLDILCIQETRVVGNDNTVRYKRLTLQIPEDRHRHHYVKAKVKVHEYHQGQLAIVHGPRCLARYNPDGSQRKETTRTAA